MLPGEARKRTPNMKPEIRKGIRKADTKSWKEFSLEFGEGVLALAIPPDCLILSMKDVPVVADPRKSIEEALSPPAGSPPVEEIIRNKRRPASRVPVAIAVSDITRPGR